MALWWGQICDRFTLSYVNLLITRAGLCSHRNTRSPRPSLPRKDEEITGKIGTCTCNLSHTAISPVISSSRPDKSPGWNRWNPLILQRGTSAKTRPGEISRRLALVSIQYGVLVYFSFISFYRCWLISLALYKYVDYEWFQIRGTRCRRCMDLDADRWFRWSKHTRPP